MSDPPVLSKAQKVFTMLAALLGLLLAALDNTIVATAGPVIQKKLSIEPGLYVWITTSYLVSSTVLVPIYGKLSDLYGRRRVLLAAIVIFLAGSSACGVSQTAMQLIAARALQGVGSAGLFTSAFAVVADLFPPAERSKWQGLFGAAFGVSSVIGPLLGGFITDHFGWHWAFFINLPIGAIAIGFIVSHMPPLRPTDKVHHALDIAGALALAVATLPLLLALSLGHSADVPKSTGWPWLSWQIGALIGTSILGVIVFIVIEKRAESPLLDLRLFERRAFSIGSLGAFMLGCTFLGAIIFLPVFMVNVVGLSATSSGLTTVPLTFGIVFANIVSGQAVSRIGSYKGLLLASIAIQIAAWVLLALTTTTDSGQIGMGAKMVLLGVGLGPAIPLFTLAIQTAVPPHEIGVATASATFFRQMGAVLGLAVVGTMFATTAASTIASGKHELAQELPAFMRPQFESPNAGGGDGGEGAAQLKLDPAQAIAAADAKIDVSPMPPEMKAQAKAGLHRVLPKLPAVIQRGLTDGLVRMFWAAMLLAIVGFFVTLLLPALPLRAAGGRPPAAE